MLVACGLPLVALTGCEREQRRFTEIAPLSAITLSQPHAGLSPAAVAQDGELPRNTRVGTEGLYDRKAFHVAEGKHLFIAMNCNGCHGQGGGGEGPSLIDNRWRYGSEAANIFATIAEGRPNGMPSYRGKLTQQQLWQIVSYVRALGGLLALDVLPGRSDNLSGHPPENMLRHDGETRPEAVP